MDDLKVGKKLSILEFIPVKSVFKGLKIINKSDKSDNKTK